MSDAGVVRYCFGILCVIFCFLNPLHCRAQSDVCILAPGESMGSLLITPGIGCFPLKIKATSGLTDVKNVRYVYNYQGGAVQEADLTSDSVYTYTKPGLYRVLQYSEQGGQPLRACAMVLVYDTLPPELAITGCLNRATVRIPRAAEYQYDWYAVDWGDGTQEQLDGVNPVGVHTYSDDSQRLITVRGVHLYGNCGGTAQVRFRPSRKADTPVINQIRAVSAKGLELTFTNPGTNPVWLEQRSPGGTYQRMERFDETLKAVFQVEADTTVSVCFRLVLADTCLQAPPSAEVCYNPPRPPDPAPEPDSTVFMPDAFSPNADGINDRLLPQGLLSGRLRLTVYNRWGEVVFRSEDAREGWDGQQRGQPLPAGAYLYRLEMQKPNGTHQEKRGTVILIN
ncbi:gliding motility-associated-like protein [Larkinella arboricola]|uniref:Gliding motility-associated-like protein n=1 Tax=Larkinella arboricola TaxID=643671 RepID=A0A327WM60_LARAB|nr:gliding motility-associated C-terminal domain-containing protein [Larkinella arboricola]RAJ92501.1 gliding motility-associated-like protein [Larkinella arboricola]